MTTGIEREPTFYDAQLIDDAMLGDATAENIWHPRKRDPYKQELRQCFASFDQIVRQHYAREEAA